MMKSPSRLMSATLPILCLGLAGCGAYDSSSAGPAANDQSIVAYENTSTGFYLDSAYVDGPTATYFIDQSPQYGSVAIDPSTGYVTYQPATDYIGSDYFYWEVDDQNGASNVAECVVNVATAVPVANDQNVGTLENTSVGFYLDASYVDEATATFLIDAPPGLGTLSIDPTTGYVVYVPYANAVGTDDFTWEIDDQYGNSNIGECFVLVNAPG